VIKRSSDETAHRVAVVDDHDMMREGLTLGLRRRDDIDVVGSGRSIADFRQSFEDWDPDVVIADYQLPDGTGLEIIKLVREFSASCHVIIVTGLERTGLLHDVISAGGEGLLNKSVTIAELADAIVAVANGSTAFPSDALRDWARRDLSDVGATLTPREREVLALLAQAKSTAAIASELTVSGHTVRNHIRAILTKLQATTQLEAVVTAQREGLV
jgi:DNA-binding NarL/FixJ family response regulator